VRQARRRWGRDEVVLPGDAAARVTVTRADASRVSMSPQYIEFKGATGRLMAIHDRVGAAAETRGVFYVLHLGWLSDGTTRWLYFIASFMGTALVGTGLVMWTVKLRRDPDRPSFGLGLVERLNIVGIAGLSVAMTAFLWTNWLLPPQLPARADWEIHAQHRRHPQLFDPCRLGGAQQSVQQAQRPNAAVAEGDGVLAGVDLRGWALAFFHGVLAIRMARHNASVRSWRETRGRVPNAVPVREVAG
jgi:hypothetical protein